MFRFLHHRNVRTLVELLLALCTLALILQLFLALRTSPLVFDEINHFDRITSILSGTFGRAKFGAMLPGYHYLVSEVLFVLGARSVAAARLVTLILSILSCGAAYLVAHTLQRETALLRTLQYATLPILLPFFPLVYTDTTSLLFVLLAVFFALKRMPLLSGLASLASILIRQNNIVWVPLLALIVLSRSPSWALDLSALQDRFLQEIMVRLKNKKSLLEAIKSLLPFAIPVGGFLLFLVLNGSPVLNRSEMHPFPGIFTGNVSFTLLLFAALFFPLVVERAWERGRSILRESWVRTLVLLLLLFLWITFRADHPINQDLESVRNQILLFAGSGTIRNIITFIPIALALLTLCSVRMAKPILILLCPLAFVYLGASWFIETRYAIVPLALFLLFREKQSWRQEVLQFAWNVLLCLWVFF